MKKKFFLSIVIILIVVIAAAVCIFSYCKSTQALTNKGPQIILFYGDGCPHCKVVEKFIKKNNLDDKISLVKKEVYYNSNNSAELVKKAKKCGAIENGGVPIPLLWEGSNKCVHGDKEIINYFSQFLKSKQKN
jgi:hypothetical protein